MSKYNPFQMTYDTMHELHNILV